MNRLTFSAALAAAMAYGLAAGINSWFPANLVSSVTQQASDVWDDVRPGRWDKRFSAVKIKSTHDQTDQPAYFLPTSQKAPLVVSLHSWSGTYQQTDPLSPLVADEGWNYIRPHTRGANRSPDACLSPAVIADIDDAIAYAIRNGQVDESRVFVVGGSGGAYMALGHYLRGKRKAHTYIAFNPMTDLGAWKNQSAAKKTRYAEDIEQCAGSDTKSRSPLHWPDKSNSRLELFAGLNDGHSGSVPISHSLDFFNKVSTEPIPVADYVSLLTRDVTPQAEKVSGRSVYYRKEASGISLVVFDGKHEVLNHHLMERMRVASPQ